MVRPDDLVEVWHMVVADGAEPQRWTLPEPLWAEVKRVAHDNGQMVEDPGSGDRALLGSPVEVDPAALTPVLYVRRNGAEEAVPIIGSME